MRVKVTNAAGERPTLWLYGVIGELYDGVTAEHIREALVDIPSKQAIDLRIHSEGGDFTESIAIHSILSRRQGDVHVIIDGRAYSGGSVVAMVGKTIEMARGAWMMIHEAAGSIRDARAKDMRKGADMLDAINGQLVDIYARRWKGSREELAAALDEEKWLKDQSAVDMGLADSVADSMAAAAYVDPAVFNYKNMPEPLVKSAVESYPIRTKAESFLAEWLSESAIAKNA